ncbi:MAG: PAS domain S-box protein [Deltaproteobacteria bacterium]|nr:PAS domain S-box protein [Deltaproteobacteria bacterium]
MRPERKKKKDPVLKVAAPPRRLKDYASIAASPRAETPANIPIQYLTPMLDNAQEAIVVHQDEVIKYVNKRASEIDGRPIRKLIGKQIRETTHPDDYELVLRNYLDKLQGKAVNKYRYRGIDRQGHVMWFEIFGTAILWDGRPAVMNFITDVTGHVRAEEDLKKSERMLRDIINFLPEPTFAVDEAGKIISWNREMEKMFGIKAEKMLGKGNYEYALPFYGRRMPMLIDLILRPDEARERQYAYFKRDEDFLYAEESFQLRGETYTLWCKASLIYDHRDQVVGAIESMRDITDLKNAVAELKNKSLHLEEANTALKVLLEHRKNDRKEIEESIAGNVKTLVVPYLNKLKNTGLKAPQEAYIHILEAHLAEIISPFLTNMTMRQANLTPREIQIADLVKEGRSAKEISQILNIALHTVNNYRKRLRKKFSLSGKDNNLRTHLLSFT